MASAQTHNTNVAGTSNTQAAVNARRCESLLIEFNKLEAKFNEDVNSERNAPTIFRYSSHTNKKRAVDFKPRVVSIGPYYHKDETLEDMEGKKRELMFDLLSKKHARTLLPNLMLKVTELLDRARKCYGENIELEDDAFAQMLLVDSCFIIRFLVSMTSQETHESLISLDWNINEIRTDLLLMENQIPLVVVWNVYDIIQRSCVERNLPRGFDNIVREFIRMDIPWGVSHKVSCRVADHLLDLYWLSFMYDETELTSRVRGGERTTKRLRSEHVYAPVNATRNIPSATELNRVAGVIFEQDKSNSIELHRVAGVKNVVIEIDEPSSNEPNQDDGGKVKPDKLSSMARFRKGTLVMSSLKVDKNMTIIMTNLIGYEKNLLLPMRKVSSYMLLMDSLINTEEDVALLQESGIIVNALDTNLNAAIFFNDVGNMCTVDYEKHHFAELFADVHKHYTSSFKRTLASLNRDYCNSAWARISVAAAIFLLILTVIQTVLGGVQTKYAIHPSKN